MQIQPSPEIPVKTKKLPKADTSSNTQGEDSLPRESDLTSVNNRLQHLQIATFADLSYEKPNLIMGQFAAYAAMEADQHAIIAFRGTNSLENWKVNSQIGWTESPPRHQGFDLAWRTLKSEVENWLSLKNPKLITLTGHSLGGAIATIAALDLAKSWTIAEIVTFGCPRVGSSEFVMAYSPPKSGKKPTVDLGAITTRYIKSTDLIARVPWEFIGYRHVGKCNYFNSKGEQIKTPPGLLERIIALSDNEKKAKSKYPGKLGQLNSDSELMETQNPARLYATLELLSRKLGLSGWAGVLSILIIVLINDGYFRHRMDGYIAFLQKRTSQKTD